MKLKPNMWTATCGACGWRQTGLRDQEVAEVALDSHRRGCSKMLDWPELRGGGKEDQRDE